MPDGQDDGDQRLRQEVKARRDAYSAGANLVNITFPAGVMQEPRPGHAWGGVPARNLGFTGREQLLAMLREALVSGDRAVVQALHGMGGVGKTQLAVEYAHRYATDYDLLWWVMAEQPEVIGGQFAALAVAMGCAEAGAAIGVVRLAVLGALRRQRRWLLVFDNAESPGDIAPWLPGGAGHVLITSRAHGWEELAVPVEVGPLARSESVTILQRRVPGLAAEDAARLAGELGDLPLAVAQAAGYLPGSGMSAAAYLGLLRTRSAEILDLGTPVSYPRSLAAATQLSVERLATEDPAAAQLINVAAFLAPEPIPQDLFTAAAAQLPDPLAGRAEDPLAWSQLLARLATQSLARVDQHGLQLHRLTQAIVRDRLPPARAAVIQACAEAILAAYAPGSPEDPLDWPRWGRLTPHLLTAGLAATTSASLRHQGNSAIWYLLMRGETELGHNLASRLYQQWRTRLGGDDLASLRAATSVAEGLRQMGRFADARDVDADCLSRRRRVLGDDHPNTLASANNLAMDMSRLGEVQSARDLNQDTLARRRRVLGDDHPDTLRSASNLAIDMSRLGEVQLARDLDQDTLARRRRVLGDDYPDTLDSASDLACDLRALGEVQLARDLDQDTLARRRRVLGDDHPDTLDSASNLANDLHTP